MNYRRRHEITSRCKVPEDQITDTLCLLTVQARPGQLPSRPIQPTNPRLISSTLANNLNDAGIRTIIDALARLEPLYRRSQSAVKMVPPSLRRTFARPSGTTHPIAVSPPQRMHPMWPQSGLNPDTDATARAGANDDGGCAPSYFANHRWGGLAAFVAGS
jgi:hypothetical protein